MRYLIFGRKNKTKKISARLFLCCLAFLIVFSGISLKCAIEANGESELTPGTRGTLTVKDGEQVIKVFSKEELMSIANAEGDQKYAFSVYSAFPSHDFYENSTGPTVKAVLTECGLWNQLNSNDTLIFSDRKPTYTYAVTASQITEPRWCFPHGNMDPQNYGLLYDDELEADKTLVPAIIALDPSGSSQLRFGQKYYTEQITPAFVKGIADGGCIKVVHSVDTWAEASITNNIINGKITRGSLIHFDTSNLSVSTGELRDAIIYYTTDGTTPDQKSAMYNYIGDRWIEEGKENESRRFPDTSQLGPLTLKTIVIGIGKNASPVTTFNLEVVEPEHITSCDISLSSTRFPYTGASIRPSVTVKNGSKILQDGVDYIVSYSGNTNAGTATVTIEGIGAYTGTTTKTFVIQPVAITSVALPATSRTYTGNNLSFTKSAFVVKSVIGGSSVRLKTDSYTVAYKNNKSIGTASVTISGKGNYSGQIRKSFRILPGKASLARLTPGKKKLTVRYKKLAGGVRYKLAVKQTGKSWKYYSNGTKLSRTIYKLKSGKQYQVKIRAYKVVSRKTYYGPWSYIKKAKVK